MVMDRRSRRVASPRTRRASRMAAPASALVSRSVSVMLCMVGCSWLPIAGGILVDDVERERNDEDHHDGEDSGGPWGEGGLLHVRSPVVVVLRRRVTTLIETRRPVGG